MLQNYLKIALRNLVKNTTYSFINIVGLAIGMAVSVLILMFVMHEFSYDKFHTNGDRIYSILAKVKMGDQDMQFNSFTQKLGPALKASNAQVKDFVRIKSSNDKVVFKNPAKPSELFYEQNFMFADPSFFKVFSFKLKEGNLDQILNKPYQMVISERAAKKYFGDENPVGKSLIYEGKHLFQITGIAENPPSNSTFNFDFVASTITYPQLSTDNAKNWEVAGMFNTYLLLDKPESTTLVEKNIAREGNKTGAFDSNAKYVLEAFSTTHLGNNFNDSGNSKLIYIFIGIAAIILFLALFNYMSLTTARSTLRAREVGVRKVVGAGRSGLVKQFYIESMLVCSIAFVLSFILVQLLRQPFYDILDLRIDPSFLYSKSFIGFVIALLVFSALLAGSYPALVLSGFAPLDVLKGKFSVGGNGSIVRRFFMVLQFTVSIALIVCSLVVSKQLEYMQNKKLGVNKDQVLSIPLYSSVVNNYFALRDEIKNLSGVQAVTISDVGLFKGYNMFFTKNFTTGKDVSVVDIVVDQNFIKTMGLAMKIKPDSVIWKNKPHFILNETAIKQLGFRGNPIGQKVLERNEVAGIISDFNYSGVQSGIKAMGIFVITDTTNILKVLPHAVLYARLGPKVNLKERVGAISEIFKKYDPEKPFEYYFLDEAFNQTFKTEIRMAKMFSVFTAFAIFIACMGLFGLVTFTAETRTKEIGIRKVLGASIAGIVGLLSGDFVKLILLSILFAIPLAYYFMDKWLQDFSYRITIPIWISVAASLMALVVAMLTISFQSIKAALKDPVKSLRSE